MTTPRTTARVTYREYVSRPAFEKGQLDYFDGYNEPCVDLTESQQVSWLSGWKDAQSSTEYDYS